jgi:hypothetical protein
MRTGVPVVSLGGWEVSGSIDRPLTAATVDEAVSLVLAQLG